MKNLKETLYKKLLIKEKLIINKNIKIDNYRYQPKDKDELEELVKKLIEERGNEADLNDIDTSEITDMSFIFMNSKFNGDISKWDVSSVENMSHMFINSKFNGDISEWDVSSVENMSHIFVHSQFNGDISEWNVSKVKDMSNMFAGSPLEYNPPKWYKK